MSNLVKVNTSYVMNEDITREQAMQKINDFIQKLNWYSDDANRCSNLERADDAELISFVNSQDFNVIYKILNCNGSVFFC